LLVKIVVFCGKIIEIFFKKNLNFGYFWDEADKYRRKLRGYLTSKLVFFTERLAEISAIQSLDP